MRAIKKNCGRFILIALMIISAFHFTGNDCLAEKKSVPEVTMHTKVGNNGYVRYGRYGTVLVKLKSVDRALFGSLLVRVCDNTTLEDFSFERELVLQPGTEKEEIFYIPVDRYISGIQVTLREGKEKVIKREEKTVNTDFFTGTIFVGSLDEKGKLQEEDNQKWNLKKIMFSKEEFPEEEKGLDVLDLLAVTPEILEQLNKKQRNALRQWEEGGGSLLVDTEENDFWDNAMEQLSDARRNQIEREAETYSRRGYYQDSNSVPYNEKFSIKQISLILLLYLAFTGPVVYWMFKKKKQGGRIWPAVYIPICAAFFTLLIWGMGKHVKISSPASIYRSVLHLDEKGKGEENIGFRIFSTDNKEYHVQVNSEYDIAALPDYYAYYSGMESSSKCRVNIEQKGGYNQIKVKEFPAFSSAYFQARMPVSLSGTIKPDLTYENYLLSGSITNELGYEINQAVIVCNRAVTEIGTIKKNETIHLDEKRKTHTLKKDGLYEIANKLISNSRGKEKDMQERARKSVIEEYLNQALDGTLEECFLLGFIPNYKNRLFENQDTYVWGETAVYIPLTISNRGNIQILIPDIKPYLISMEGDYDNIEGQFGGRMAIAKYYIPDSEKLYAIEYNAEQNSGTVWKKAFSGTIELYNFRKQKYMKAFTGGYTSRINNPSEYINQSDRLLVRYLSDSQEAFEIPALSIWKEGD